MSNQVVTLLDMTKNSNPPVSSNPEDILSSEYWKNTEAFKSIKEKMTQRRHYKMMKSSKAVTKLVRLSSKPFGTTMEMLIREIFNLQKRSSTENDAMRNGKKIEIKAARYWKGEIDCYWQHLQEDYDYEFVLFGLLEADGIKVWGMKKTFLMTEMRDKNIVTGQGKKGKKGNQGYWVKKSSIEPYLTSINNIPELDVFLQT